MTDSDPFRHHPELRRKIKPAVESFFRDLDLSVIDARAAEAGRPAGWRTPDEEREAGRRDWLKDRWDQDLWVFGYGSLMWDPSVELQMAALLRTADIQTIRSESRLPALPVEMCMVQQLGHSTLPSLSRTAQRRRSALPGASTFSCRNDGRRYGLRRRQSTD